MAADTGMEVSVAAALGGVASEALAAVSEALEEV
jgi:hypothetical protein